MGTIVRTQKFILDGFPIQEGDRIIMTVNGQLERGVATLNVVGKDSQGGEIVEALFRGDGGHSVEILSGASIIRDNSITDAVQATSDPANASNSFDTLDGTPLKDGENLLVSFPDGSLVQGSVTLRTETPSPEHTYQRSYFSKEDGVLVTLHRQGVTAKRGS